MLNIGLPASYVPYKLVTFLVLFLNIMILGKSQMNSLRIGVLTDNNTRMGKEIATAIKVAGQGFSKDLAYYKGPSGTPLQAIYAAEELVKDKKVQAIVGMITWEETALVASVGNQAKIPTISFSGSAVGTPNTPQTWPFLVQMVPDIKQQIRCITNIVSSFLWRKVIVIYEVDSHGNDAGNFAMLSDGLQAVNVEIEHSSVLPPLSSLSDPQSYIHMEVANLLSKQSRVFIVLKSSLTWCVHLFREARELKLVEKGSAWIISDPLAGLLDSVNTSALSPMEGALGVTTFFSESSKSFHDFKQQFQQIFRADYPEEQNFEPSLYALRAFDSITAVKQAVEKLNSSTINSTNILRALLSSNFTGLSGIISFENGELIQPSVTKIVNVMGRKYKDLGAWSPNLGFSRTADAGESRRKVWENTMTKWSDSINWPGELKQAPKGLSMPTETNPLIIGVPARTTFEKFVKVTFNSSTNSWSYTGFCIDVFHEVVRILEQSYHLPYEFRPFNGSYDELIECVANKTFDAVVGDTTILANRSLIVEFTQPFAESGLRMVVTVKKQAQNQAWIFVCPFTGGMWAVTGLIMIYTVLIVWLLERKVSPEFTGQWWNQLNTAIWFTCSTLYFAHREKIYNGYTRVVVLVWLFVVLALTSSYTASLSSMLTVPSLIPSVTDIKWLKDNNAKIGCDGDSFVMRYMINVLGFNPDNIINIKSEYDYPKAFESGNITAAFLELPYEKAFLNYYCTGYAEAGNTSDLSGDRFGGLGFVFQKGSPLVEDVSRAILTISERGRLKQLDLQYFSPAPRCSQSSDSVDRLNWQSFWALYFFSAGTSAICYLLFTGQRFYEWWRLHQPQLFLDIQFFHEFRENYLRWLL